MVVAFRSALLNNGFCYQFTFLIVGKCALHLDAVPNLVVRKYMLFELIFIIRNNAIGYFNNVLRGPVILLQFIYLQIWIIAFKIEDILDIGPPKRIDTLRIVTNYADVLIGCGQFFYDGVLRKVGILVLIYH